MGKHALLSASSSHRWLNCPPSARLSEHYADQGSEYAAEGTEAHALCEYKLKTVLGLKANNPAADLRYYCDEMEDCANGYAAFILELVATAKQTCRDPIVLIEQRLDFSRYVRDAVDILLSEQFYQDQYRYVGGNHLYGSGIRRNRIWGVYHIRHTVPEQYPYIHQCWVS